MRAPTAHRLGLALSLFACNAEPRGGLLIIDLRTGDTVGLVCFPGDSPYFVTARVEGRETVRAMGRDWPAICLRLGVRKLEVKDKRPTEAVDYAKFRSGTVWVSDDARRVPLRAEVNVMVGFIYGELTGLEWLERGVTR